MFTLTVVYQFGGVFTCQSADLDEITNWAKLCLPDEDTTYVQVSGTLFGPVMFSSTREAWIAKAWEEKAEREEPAMLLDLPKGVYYSPARQQFGKWELGYMGGLAQQFVPINPSLVPQAWRLHKEYFPAPPDEGNYSLNKAMEGAKG